MHKKSISAGALPQTPLGPGVYSAPQAPYSCNKGNILLREGERYRKGKGRTWREGRGGERTGEEGKGMEENPVCIFTFYLE